jgi:hypothetical protein
VPAPLLPKHRQTQQIATDAGSFKALQAARTRSGREVSAINMAGS